MNPHHLFVFWHVPEVEVWRGMEDLWLVHLVCFVMLTHHLFLVQLWFLPSDWGQSGQAYDFYDSLDFFHQDLRLGKFSLRWRYDLRAQRQLHVNHGLRLFEYSISIGAGVI